MFIPPKYSNIGFDTSRFFGATVCLIPWFPEAICSNLDSGVGPTLSKPGRSWPCQALFYLMRKSTTRGIQHEFYQRLKACNHVQPSIHSSETTSICVEQITRTRPAVSIHSDRCTGYHRLQPDKTGQNRRIANPEGFNFHTETFQKKALRWRNCGDLHPGVFLAITGAASVRSTIETTLVILRPVHYPTRIN